MSMSISKNIGRYRHGTDICKNVDHGVISGINDNLNSLVNLANILSYSDDKADVRTAIWCYERALRKSNFSGIVNYRLGNLYQRNNNLDQAIESYKQAVSDNELMHLAWYRLGNAYQKKMLIDDALVAYDKAIDLYDEDPGYLFQRGVCFYSKKLYHNVVADLVTALTLSPKCPAHFQHLLGLAYYRIKNHNRAVVHLRLAKEYDSSY